MRVGVSLPTLMVALLGVLKVGEVGEFADWSWWMVFAPWIIAAGIFLFMFAVALIDGD